MTDWAFQTWPRILAGAFVLATGFALIHVMAGVVTGYPAAADWATATIFVLFLVGYLIIGAFNHRNPHPDGE